VPAAYHHVRAIAAAAGPAEVRGELAPLGPAADHDRPAAGVGDAGAEHQADRAGAEDRDRVAALHVRPGHAVEATRERLDERGDLGREAVGDGEEVAAGDPLRHEQELRVGAVQQRKQALAEGLVAAPARPAVPARRGVGRDHAPAGRRVHPAELVPERARPRAEQHGVTPVVRLRVGAVGECDLDLDEHVAGSRLGTGDVLEPDVARPVEDQRPHGVKTTFRASPRR
jgi:hypothetical protein